jgi:hypothetical protein
VLDRRGDGAVVPGDDQVTVAVRWSPRATGIRYGGRSGSAGRQRSPRSVRPGPYRAVAGTGPSRVPGAARLARAVRAQACAVWR